MPASPISRLQSTIATYRAQLAAHEASAEQTLATAYVRALQALEPQLNALYKQIAAEYASGGVDHIPLNWLYESQRLYTIEQNILSQFNHFGSVSQLTVQQLRQLGLSLGVQGASASLNAQVPASISYVFGQPSPQAIASLVGATQSGSPLATLFASFGADAAQNVRQSLITGLSLGQSVPDIARAIQNALNVERNRSLTIARTELLRSYRGGSLETYRANDSIVGQWRWTCAHSSRTCIACLAMDGTLHDLDEDMESHVNCRCTAVPVLNADWAQVDIQSGSDWLDEQPEDVQKQILGNKYDGWSNGDFSLSDMVGKSSDPNWGGSIYVKSLKQLAA